MSEIPRFAADRMLHRLAKWLRLLGADVIAGESLHGSELLRAARAESRMVLTRDKRLRLAADVVYIESNFFREQLRQVLTAFPFDFHQAAFSRCSECNAELRRVGRDVARSRVPMFVYASQDQFAQCDVCGRVYWGATHVERMLRELETIGIGETKTSPHT